MNCVEEVQHGNSHDYDTRDLHKLLHAGDCNKRTSADSKCDACHGNLATELRQTWTAVEVKPHDAPVAELPEGSLERHGAEANQLRRYFFVRRLRSFVLVFAALLGTLGLTSIRISRTVWLPVRLAGRRLLPLALMRASNTTR